MAKAKTIFYCKECGNETSKWVGQCPACHRWDTMVEAPEKKAGGMGSFHSVQVKKPVRLSEIPLAEEERIKTGMKELDRVLGGGIVAGSLVLASGDPGIGKSTLLLQMCRNLSDVGHTVLYVSGEESLRQIKLRAVRIGEFQESLLFLAENDLQTIRDTIMEYKPQVVVIDSVQTMVHPDLESAPGSVGQIREITSYFLRLAKENEISIFLVGHVTKDGAVAGPRMLEHMVDTVLYFEGESTTPYRILRAVKNRFGSTNEIGVFEMRQNGLLEVDNPSAHMLKGMPEEEPGSIVTVALEGTRPILLEVQALVCRTNFNLPKRTAAGTDYNRVNLLMAVIEKRLGASLSSCDAYINVAGGLRVTEPALDLGIVLAILSGYWNRVLPERTVAFGEVGLTGEVRGVSQAVQRAKEAEKLGYQRCIMSAADAQKIREESNCSIRIVGIRNVKELEQVLK